MISPLRLLAPLILFALVVGVLEALSQAGIVPRYLLPPPSEVWTTLRSDAREYLQAGTITLTEAGLGLLLSFLVGNGLAVLMSVSRWLSAALQPYAVFFQTVPLIAIAPLLVIWFGYGIPTVVVAAFIVSVFPVIVNTLAGCRAVDPALRDLFQLYRASRSQTLMKLTLPHAIPHMVTGLRIAAGLAMIGAIVGEFIAGGGLGGLIDAARTQQRLDKVFAAVLLASLAGALMVGLINLSAHVFLGRWRELSTD